MIREGRIKRTGEEKEKENDSKFPGAVVAASDAEGADICTEEREGQAVLLHI